MIILVIRLSALGDVAMTIPAIYSVARAYPRHRFLVLTSPFCGRLFVNRPQNVVILEPPSTSLHGPMGTLGLTSSLWGLPIDAVADLHNVLRSWVLDWSFFVRAVPVTMLDKKRSERREITLHRAVGRPFTLRYLDVFSRLGLPTGMTFTSLFEGNCPSWPASIPFRPNARKVGIAPFARYATKTYPTRRMHEVVRLLLERPEVDVYLFGARGQEAGLLESWEQEMPRVCSVAGRLQLEGELALMAHLDVMLTMDSANMHLASLVGTRVVSVWGGTTPACGFLGYRQSEEDALCAGLECQPCSISGSKRCPRGTLACMEAISPADIIKAL